MSAAALNVLISQLRDLVEEYKAKRSQLENQTVRRPAEKAMEIDSDEEPDEEAADNKLQEAFLSLKKKIEIVKKSVPEGRAVRSLAILTWYVQKSESAFHSYFRYAGGRRPTLCVGCGRAGKEREGEHQEEGCPAEGCRLSKAGDRRLVSVSLGSSFRTFPSNFLCYIFISRI